MEMVGEFFVKIFMLNFIFSIWIVIENQFFSYLYITAIALIYLILLVNSPPFLLISLKCPSCICMYSVLPSIELLKYISKRKSFVAKLRASNKTTIHILPALP